MQPYPNPNYFAQNQYPGIYQPAPMPNPYMERMNQLQQYQQNLQMQPAQMSGVSQPQGLIGKVVNDFSEITANDVPMNGVSAVFPKADLSEVQLRTWTANGTIQTITYKPILEQNQADVTNIPQNDFAALNEDVRALREEISARFDRLEQSIAVPAAKTASKSKKGDVDNE